MIISEQPPGMLRRTLNSVSSKSKTVPTMLLLKLIFIVVLLLQALLIVKFVSAPYINSAAFSSEENAARTLEWVRSHPQGDVHPSVEARREVAGDSRSILGLYASSDPYTQQIKKGDIIATIPWELIINPGNKYNERTFWSCDIFKNLASELRLGDDSFYSPYIRYLLSQPRTGLIPSDWSAAAQELLAQIVGKGTLPPFKRDWYHRADFEKEWIRQCHGSREDEIERLAYYLVTTRDEDTLMIPVYDLANHVSDPDKLNTLSYKPKRVGDSFKLVASRDIARGEQVTNSYNRCHPCSGTRDEDCSTYSHYGTPELLWRFGFVDDYPQTWRWTSSTGKDDESFDFCLDRHRGTKELEVWMPPTVHISQSAVDFLQREVKRLDELSIKNSDDLKSRFVTNVHEWDTIWRYHNALTVAMRAALDSVRDEK